MAHAAASATPLHRMVLVLVEVLDAVLVVEDVDVVVAVEVVVRQVQSDSRLYTENLRCQGWASSTEAALSVAPHSMHVRAFWFH